jgi:hypothetical protein
MSPLVKISLPSIQSSITYTKPTNTGQRGRDRESPANLSKLRRIAVSKSNQIHFNSLQCSTTGFIFTQTIAGTVPPKASVSRVRIISDEKKSCPQK